ncbi:MAG: efflux RND transporter periplasmic adaptor subunit [Candidatus Omnitrophica bacterium]|nr:efflux RND transporter periplasmic adaptor subunit [Candidatus Omnitrophota bacterium]
MRYHKIIPAVTLATALFVVSGCGGDKKQPKDDFVPVRVITVKVQDIHRALDYAGSLKGKDEAIVYPKVSGKVIEKVKEEGSDVKKGDAIVYIDRDEVGLKFEKAPVESPLTGTVGRVYVDIGSNVTVQTPIAFVADMSQTEIYLDIPEAYLPQLALGQKAEITVDAHPGEIFRGEIIRISPVVELSTRTAPIEILIDNPEKKLQSGMFGKVHLRLEEHKQVPVIPKEAVIGRHPDTYTYIIENDKSYMKKITLGIKQGPIYEVLDGVKPGDRVVIMGQQKLRDGVTVRVEEK